VVAVSLNKTLPFPEPDRLVRVWHVPPKDAFPGRDRFAVSAGNFLEWQKQNHVFEKMSIVGYRGLTMTGVGEPEAITAGRVSPDFFSVRQGPILGRGFTSQTIPRSNRVLVLS
jgi:hypothetical protein